MWYGPTMAFARASIGIQFLRLTMDRVQRILIYVVLAFSVVCGLAIVLVFLLQCHPMSYFWDKNQDGVCIDPEILVIAMYPYSAQALFCDLSFAILPIFLVRGLQMDRNTKTAVIILLGLGCTLVFYPELIISLTNRTDSYQSQRCRNNPHCVYTYVGRAGLLLFVP
jgi:hypothetical protein